MSLWDQLQHAFAVDPPLPPVSAEQAAVVDVVCAQLQRRGLLLPAAMILESTGPLTSLAAQFLVFVEPWLTTVVDASAMQHLTAYLERRDAGRDLLTRLDALANATEAPSDPTKTGGAES